MSQIISVQKLSSDSLQELLFLLCKYDDASNLKKILDMNVDISNELILNIIEGNVTTNDIIKTLLTKQKCKISMTECLKYASSVEMARAIHATFNYKKIPVTLLIKLYSPKPQILEYFLVNNHITPDSMFRANFTKTERTTIMKFLIQYPEHIDRIVKFMPSLIKWNWESFIPPTIVLNFITTMENADKKIKPLYDSNDSIDDDSSSDDDNSSDNNIEY